MSERSMAKESPWQVGECSGLNGNWLLKLTCWTPDPRVMTPITWERGPKGEVGHCGPPFGGCVWSCVLLSLPPVHGLCPMFPRPRVTRTKDGELRPVRPVNKSFSSLLLSRTLLTATCKYYWRTFKTMVNAGEVVRECCNIRLERRG